jgi:signal transduction histidine kinase
MHPDPTPAALQRLAFEVAPHPPEQGGAAIAVDRLLRAADEARRQGHSPARVLAALLVGGASSLGFAALAIERAADSVTRRETAQVGARTRLAIPLHDASDARLVVEFMGNVAELDPERFAALLALGQRALMLSDADDNVDAIATARRFETLGRLTSGVAHDYNNALTAVLGYVQLLSAEASADETTHKLAASAIESIAFAAALTRQLLEFSRGHGDIEWLSLNDVITRFDHLLRSLLGDRRRLVLALGSAAPKVRASPTAIGQVLLNLVANARDALADGGTVEIFTANDFMTDTRCAVLGVRDDGPGIAAEIAGRIFDPLFTTKAPGKGTGLGLSTVRSIVTELGGDVRVESAPGAGATFLVRIPSADRHEVDGLRGTAHSN